LETDRAGRNRNHDAIDVSFLTIDLNSEVRPITFGLISFSRPVPDRYRQTRHAKTGIGPASVPGNLDSE